MEKMIIIGAGPGGISAALYAFRGNMDPLVINNGIGALEKAERIENYYGTGAVSGRELYENGLAQAETLGVRILEAQVLGMQGLDTFSVVTTEGVIEAESVILATGGRRRAPDIPGIRELEGKGVSYCAVCDAFFYRGKNVAVLGNSDFALHEAEELANLAASVTIYTDGLEPQFSREHPIPVNTMRIQAVEGKESVAGLCLEPELRMTASGSKEEVFVPADGVFVAVGTAGSTEIARQMGAELTEKGNIRVNERMETSIPGLYAAGDCTGGLLQIAKAVYEGCQAGIQASAYVRRRHQNEIQ